MKPNTKIISSGALLFVIGLYTACIKDKPLGPSQNTAPNYLANFYAANGVQMQTYTINASNGGSFTTPQGTVVNIPGANFVDNNGISIVGTVTVQFKDIYTKSDMLLSNMPTNTYWGTPLKSGGEFFIKVTSNGNAVNLRGIKPITITQPFNGWPADKMMQAFTLQFDTAGNRGWAGADSLSLTLTNYVFSLYNFNSPSDSGTWCNSDNSQYFSAYPQTQLNILTTDDSLSSGVDVFIAFTGLNCLVHVYPSYSMVNSFPYGYAPLGLQCTVIALETRANGQLRAAFVPTTITANGTVNFNCTPTTTAAFKTKMATYNH